MIDWRSTGPCLSKLGLSCLILSSQLENEMGDPQTTQKCINPSTGLRFLLLILFFFFFLLCSPPTLFSFFPLCSVPGFCLCSKPSFVPLLPRNPAFYCVKVHLVQSFMYQKKIKRKKKRIALKRSTRT